MTKPRKSRSLTIQFPVFILSLSGFYCCCLAAEQNDEYRLYEKLLDKYNALERPVDNSSETLVIKMRLFLQQIITVDAINHFVQVNAWIRYNWTDYKLQWDPEEYGGVMQLQFPADKLWKPDVLLYNSAHDEFDKTYQSQLLVYNTGEVNWIPPGILKFSCKMDLTWFPFDDQICSLKFGSWTYNIYAVNLTLDSDEMNTTSHTIDLSDYVTNGEWILLSAPAYRLEYVFVCCPEPYPFIVFSMHIRRRTLYYGFNLVIPSLILVMMTAIGFSLPPNACEKVTLETMILFSIIVFQSMLKEFAPPESMSLIGTFYSTTMMVVAVSVIFTVVVLNLHHRRPDTYIMTPLARSIFLEWLPWLLLMHRPGHHYTKMIKNCIRKKVETDPVKIGFIETSDERHTFLRQNDYSSPPKRPSPPSPDERLILLAMIDEKISAIVEHMNQEDADDRIRNDWKFAAVVVDRLCLCVIGLFITICSCAIFFMAPHIHA